jgi:hypothetical protein
VYNKTAQAILSERDIVPDKGKSLMSQLTAGRGIPVAEQ